MASSWKFGYDFNKKDEKEKEQVKVPPPSNLQEWLKANELEDWPPSSELDIEGNPIPDYSDLLSMEGIMNTLKERVPFDTSILDTLLEQLDDLDEKLQILAQHFIQPKKQKGSQVLINEKYRASIGIMLGEASSKDEAGLVEGPRVRNIEQASYPGFFEHEFTALPGALEAPQVLNRITKLQHFPSPSFKKIWSIHFLSEASVAILQDSFWWLFLKASGKDDKDGSQSKIFNRLAESFAVLFLGMTTSEKDMFFQYYPNCLSQSIYNSFCVAFPKSINSFDEDFIEGLITTVYQWVTGTRPFARALLQYWNFDELEERRGKDFQDERGQKFKSSLSFDEDTFLETNSRCNTAGAGSARTASLWYLPPSKGESHPVGASEKFERVSFNIDGQSPLIAHFLQAKNLKTISEFQQPRTVARTEMLEYRDPNETYDQLIRNHQRDAKQREYQLQRFYSSTAKEYQELERKRKKEAKSLLDMQKELTAKHLDMKILSEKIMDIITGADFGTKLLSLSPHKEEDSF